VNCPNATSCFHNIVSQHPAQGFPAIPLPYPAPSPFSAPNFLNIQAPSFASSTRQTRAHCHPPFIRITPTRSPLLLPVLMSPPTPTNALPLTFPIHQQPFPNHLHLPPHYEPNPPNHSPPNHSTQFPQFPSTPRPPPAYAHSAYRSREWLVAPAGRLTTPVRRARGAYLEKGENRARKSGRLIGELFPGPENRPEKLQGHLRVCCEGIPGPGKAGRATRPCAGFQSQLPKGNSSVPGSWSETA
jgi:hypothetical protein